uniref:uncharacterized protein LOC120329933 isoform X2 n=1 Tax=Styela clava TaxID=7725 RepID=UPI00193936F4|nr:uncharacterized protein LOC120329933 isoform X2 [Styela clava]
MGKPRQHEFRESFPMRFHNRSITPRTLDVPSSMHFDTADLSHIPLPKDSYQYLSPIQHPHSRHHMVNIPAEFTTTSVATAEPSYIYPETLPSPRMNLDSEQYLAPIIRSGLASSHKTVNMNGGHGMSSPMLPPMYDDIREQGPKSTLRQKDNELVGSDEYWDLTSNQMTITHCGNNSEPPIPPEYDDIGGVTYDSTSKLKANVLVASISPEYDDIGGVTYDSTSKLKANVLVASISPEYDDIGGVTYDSTSKLKANVLVGSNSNAKTHSGNNSEPPIPSEYDDIGEGSNLRLYIKANSE